MLRKAPIVNRDNYYGVLLALPNGGLHLCIGATLGEGKGNRVLKIRRAKESLRPNQRACGVRWICSLAHSSSQEPLCRGCVREG